MPLSTNLMLLTLAAAVAATPMLPKGVYEMPMQRIKNQSAYGVELAVGNPPQKVVTLVDSGSFTYAVESPINQACKEGFCKDYGTYNNLTSKTAVYIYQGYNDVLIDHGLGSFINDTIRFAGLKLDNMNFGQLEQYALTFPAKISTPQAAIFGIGSNCFDATCRGYATFLQQLQERGVIDKQAFSVYLGQDEPQATGMLLLGGIDKAKRKGTVFKKKVQDPTDPNSNGNSAFVPVKSYRLVRKGSPDVSYASKEPDSALWDTGSPRMGLPENIFNQLMKVFGVPKKDQDASRIEVDCKFRKPTDDKVVVDFGDGAVIDVPVHSLVTQLSDKCVTDIVPRTGLLGDAFLRNVYATFDYSKQTVEFAAVQHTSKTDIVKIK